MILSQFRRIASARRLSGDAAVYLCATMANSAIPFLLLPFLTRWLTPDHFGLVGIYTAQVSLLSAIIGLNAQGAISVDYFRIGPGSMPPTAGAAVGIVAIVGAAALAFILAAGEQVAAFTGIPRSWLWMGVCAAVAQSLIAVVLAVLQTLRQPYRFGAIQVGYGAGLAILTVAMVAALDMGWLGRAIAQTIAATLVAGIGIWWLTVSGSLVWVARRWRFRRALQFGLPLLPHAVAGGAMNSVDRFALAGTSDPASVGHYFLAMQISSVLIVIGTALNQAWSPWLYGHLARNTDADRRRVVKLAYTIFFILLLTGASISLAAPVIVPLIAGPGFESSIPILRITSLATAFFAMYYFVSSFLFYESKTYWLSLITIGTAIIQVAITYILARHAGAIGVAYATLASFFLYFQITWYFARRAHPLPWSLAYGTRQKSDGRE